MIEAIKDTISKQVENYNKPTPKWWKVVGVILKVSGKTIAGTALFGVVGPYIGLAALIMGEVLGELTNLKT